MASKSVIVKSALHKLTGRMVRRRRFLGLTIEQASARAGVSHQYLSQVEHGDRPPSRRLAERLERVYRAPGKFTPSHLQFCRPGRRPMSDAARRAVQTILNAAPMDTPAPSRLPVPPRHPWPGQRPGLVDPLWPIGLHLGPNARTQVEQLEARCADNEFLWRMLSRQSFDSWSEKLAQVQLLQRGESATLAPGRFGCALLVVCGRTGRAMDRVSRPAVVLKTGDLAAVIWPQATVQLPDGHLRVDLLAVIASGGRRRTVAVELYSEKTHPDRARDARRAARLGIPVGRLHVRAVCAGVAVDAMTAWMVQKLAA